MERYDEPSQESSRSAVWMKLDEVVRDGCEVRRWARLESEGQK